MLRRFLKPTALGVALATFLATTGCGLVLHPERKGLRGGKVDTRILVFDLLWLIPGILPGAIMLGVDFATGCIYLGGGGPGPHGKLDKAAKKKAKLLVNKPKQLKAPVQVELRVVTNDGQVLERARTTWRPKSTGEPKLAIDLRRVAQAIAKMPTKPSLNLELLTSDGQRQIVPLKFR